MPPPPAKKGPPPLPAKKDAGGLKGADAKAHAAGEGKAGGQVQPCNWELLVKMHSQEKFWPKGAFDVTLAKPDPKGKGPGPIVQTKTIKMVEKSSPAALFKGNGTPTYQVGLALKKEPGWIITEGEKSAKEATPTVTLKCGSTGAAATKLDLFIRHPLKMHLKLGFKEPAAKVLPFPKDFTVEAYGEKDGLAGKGKTDEQGQVVLEVDRKYEWVTLKFASDKVLISNKDGKSPTNELKAWAELKNLEKAGASFWSPPVGFSLVNSDWKWAQEPVFIDGSKAYKPEEGKIYIFDAKTTNWVKGVGEENKAVELTLDPHWQFVRFEHFDRYYGHSDHGHKRVNLPPLFVESYWQDAGKLHREGGGHWVLDGDDPKKSVHAVPWVRQKDNKGAKAAKPDKTCLLMFETVPGTFVVASDAKTRKLEVLAPADKRLKPNADRLKLNDLPAVWKSSGYFARYESGGKYPGKFFEEWDAAGYAKSHEKKTPLIFSLDDVVLTDDTFAPLAMAKADRVAVFYHRFKQDYDEKANLSEEGVYLPDPKAPYLSKVELQGKSFNYLTEYPNWVRLVAAKASLFDAFNRRTSKEIFGARAAVQWYDPVKSGTPAASGIGWPAAVDKNYFAIQPYYGQEHAHTRMLYAGPATPGTRIGRYDMALLRCCDRLGAKELFVNLQYFRFLFNFTVASLVVNKQGYIQDATSHLMKRWNGYDAGVNDSRAELMPQTAADNLQGEILVFVQPGSTLADSHFRLDIKNMGAGARAWMFGVNGTGEVDDTYAKPSKSYNTQHAYVLAHEMGHGGSLPDEYGEWWNVCNHFGPGIACNIPADPFVDEGRDFDLPASLYAGANPPYPMMTMTVEMRNRYFWHCAELARKFVKTSFFVKHGKYHDYKVPGHPLYPKHSYAFWPVAASMNATRGAHGKFDVYLHAAGQERFTHELVPKGPYDGVASVLIRMKINFDPGFNVIQARDVIRSAALGLNQKFYAAGTVSVPTDAGNKDLVVGKAMLRLSPRFLIQNLDPGASNAATYAADFKNFDALIGTQFDVKVIDTSVSKKAAPGFNRGAYGLDFAADATKGNWKAVLSGQAKRYLSEMLGVAFNPKSPNLQAADLKDVAARVFTKNADVKNL